MLENFKDVKVLIVGDLMLDKYCWGSVSRISPEAPVPIVNLEKTEVTLGGAANVAANVVGLGATALLVGVVGNDSDAELFRQILDKNGISSNNLVEVSNRPTTVKTRIVAQNHHIVRIDQEMTAPIANDDEELVWNKIEKLINKVDIVIISDYAKGLLTNNLILNLMKESKLRNNFILVDPKGKDYSKYYGATLLTPNKKEAFQATEIKNVESAGKQLIQSLNLKALLITEGENGMTLFQETDNPIKLNALARKVFDVTGAGDTVIATLAVCLASGMNLRKSAEIANSAAGIVVESVGTTQIDYEKLGVFFDESSVH